MNSGAWLRGPRGAWLRLPVHAVHAAMAPPHLLELPPDLLGLVARALLCDDPQADAQAVGRLATSSKTLRQLVRGSAAVVAELQAARKMLTLQRQHALFVVAGRLEADAAFPFDPSDYKQVAQQLPAPETELKLMDSHWRVAGGERGRVAARLLRVSGALVKLDLFDCGIGDEGAMALAAGVAASDSLVELWLGDNSIGDEGAKALAAGVASSGSLTILNLAINKIGDEGAKALAAGVASSGSLKSLWVPSAIEKHGELAAACRSRGAKLVGCNPRPRWMPEYTLADFLHDWNDQGDPSAENDMTVLHGEGL